MFFVGDATAGLWERGSSQHMLSADTRSRGNIFLVKWGKK